VTGARWQPLFPLAELAAGRMRAAPAAGGEFLVCRTSEGLYALDACCTHACARLDEGRLKGTRLSCPLHAAVFDVRSGAVLAGPATAALRTHAARVVDGVVEVEAGTRT
jgi:nitrite reductase/ring-hydroxylating ferredoxin subunit